MTSISKELQVSTRIISMQPGLYGFRYETDQSAPGHHYLATLTRAPFGNGVLTFLGTQPERDAELRSHNDYVVVRVQHDSAAVLLAEYFPDATALKNRSEIVIDRLDGELQKSVARVPQGAPGQTPLPAHAAQTSTQNAQAAKTASKPANKTGAALPLPDTLKVLQAFGDPLPVSLLGHIERRGDVQVEQDWLGSPDSMARIEGFVADWAEQTPEGVELYYGSATGGQAQISMVPVGNFTGSRGRAQAITALCFDLKGEHKDRYRLVGQAVFAGTGPITIQPGKIIAGPTGSEHLVALYLTVLARRSKAEETPAKPSAWEDPSVTQVFRKKAKK